MDDVTSGLIGLAAAVLGGGSAWILRKRKRRANVKLPDALLKAAIDEQERRERAHPVEYRFDQRLKAIQQRLSRTIGGEAFLPSTRERIVKELSTRVLG